MRRKINLKALSVTFMLCVSTAGWAQYSGPGSGTENDPYLVYNAVQLSQMAYFLNQSDVVFKLMSDIDLTSWITENNPTQGWSPIGCASTPFKGEFYGNNHTISGLVIKRETAEDVGLFGYIDGATVTNLVLNAAKVSALNKVGAFVGIAKNSACKGLVMKNCGTVSGATDVGGAIGVIERTNLQDLAIDGNVTSSVSNVGGIVGSAEDTCQITDNSFKGTVSGKDNVGGIVGRLEALSSVTFTSDRTKADITATGNRTGGIVGWSVGGCIVSMNNCSHFGNIEGVDYVGGLIGISYDGYENSCVEIKLVTNKTVATKPVRDFVSGSFENLINNSSSIGCIKGNSYVGGLIGYEVHSYIHTSNSGNVSIYFYSKDHYPCNLWYDGRIIASKSQDYNHYFYPDFKALSMTLNNSYFSGLLEGTQYVGGIAGYKSCGKIQNCYTYSTICGSSNVGGIVGMMKGLKKANLFLLSNVAIDASISATTQNVGRIYGAKDNEDITIGALGSTEGNRALAQTKVLLAGEPQEVADDLQNGSGTGASSLKYKINYTAYGWNFNDDWNIIESKCYPYKKYQAAPPVIDESKLVPHTTTISGTSLNGGTVYVYCNDKAVSSAKCKGTSWSVTTEALQKGSTISVYADVDGMAPSYYTTATVEHSGDGTEDAPYLIYSAEDLQGICDEGYYKVMNDIDVSTWIKDKSPSEGWPAVGRGITGPVYVNGEGHTVRGLWMNTTEEDNGLFSSFTAGYINDLSVEVQSGKCINGGNNTGILIGRIQNVQISNCFITGDITAAGNGGGVVGQAEASKFENLSYEGKITSTNANSRIGGIVGYVKTNPTESTISACKVQATVEVDGTASCVGGLAGFVDGGTITQSMANVSITAKGSGIYVGGLIGMSDFEVSQCYSAGNVSVTGSDSYTGGLIGWSQNKVEDSYSTANVTGNLYSAGLVAYAVCAIDRCYACGDVNGKTHGGGLVGELDGEGASLSNSVAANNVLNLSYQNSNGSRVIGGFQNGAAEPLLNNYALAAMQVSLNGVVQTKTDSNLEGVAKSQAELQSPALYATLGWDFKNVWSIDKEMYPYLQCEVTENPVESITFDHTELIIAVGNEATITASVLPLNASDKRLTWTTSDATVVTVADGVVTAVKEGKADVTATADDGSGISATCCVTVVENHDNAKEKLLTLVDEAQKLYDNSTEGSEIGQYEAGARAALLTVINEVKSEITSTMSLEEISDCTSALNSAISTFRSQQVTAGADSELSDFDNVLYLDKKDGSAGTQLTYSMKMKNSVNAVGFQVDIYMPAGVTFVTDEDDFPVAELSTARTTRMKTDYFNAVVQSDGALRLLCSSTKGYAFSGADGEVATFTVQIASDMEEGDYPVILRKIEISEKNSTSHKIDYFKTTLSVSTYTLGDANGDGDVSVSDFTAIANHILGSTPASFVVKAADVNQDGDISVSDLTGVANIILYGSPIGVSSVAPMSSSLMQEAGCSDDSSDNFIINNQQFIAQ